jgi:GT2 family glycosyltransferase
VPRRWSVSIMCHDRLKLSQACLSSVLEHSPADTEIILTDNGSGAPFRAWSHNLTDGRIVRLEHAQNLGVIRPKNLALARAGGTVFVSLDNDCVVGARWLEILTQPMLDDPGIAQVGRAGAFCTISATGVGHRGGRIDYVDGSCFAVRADVARSHGLCDEAYEFCWCEDADFSLRIRRAGWRLAVVEAPVQHREHGTAGRMDLGRYWRRNHALLMRRWGASMRAGGTFGHPGEPVPRPGALTPAMAGPIVWPVD